jgi:hypothetical protein
MKYIRLINISLIILTLVWTVLNSLYKVENAEIIGVRNDGILLLTKDGNEWEYAVEGYTLNNIGDIVRVSFNCKGTEYREDDIILNIK